MARNQVEHDIISQDRANRVASESVIDFAIFLHKESSVIDNGSPKQLFHHENVIVLSLGENFYDTVLQEKERGCVVAWFLQDLILLVLLGLQAVDNVMQRVVPDVFEVFDFGYVFDDESLHSVLVGINAQFQLINEVREMDKNFFVAALHEFGHRRILGGENGS